MKYGVSQDQIAAAVELLRCGELVAFPTETVYGLGADAANELALRKLYAAKGRPTNHPVIVHIARVEQVEQWAREIPDCLEQLAKHFWPGPLTVVLKRASHVLDQVTGGQDTVAIRIPAHSVAHALLLEFRGGLAAPSANKFGRLSPTRAEAVAEEFGTEISMVLDGGPCQVGIESTILDLSTEQPRVLRPGMISVKDLERLTGLTVVSSGTNQQPEIRVPGSLSAHYAPSTPVSLVSSAELFERIKVLISTRSICVLSFRDKPDWAEGSVWRQAPKDAHEFAHGLYQNLRDLDEAKRDCIVVESPPATLEWEGVNDRLSRAACKS